MISHLYWSVLFVTRSMLCGLALGGGAGGSGGGRLGYTGGAAFSRLWPLRSRLSL